MQWIKKSTKEQGSFAENIAKEYLESKHLQFIDSNFHCRLGEIDLIMQDGDTLVFVEVKYRKKSTFGGSIAAIPVSKQQKITKSAQYYLQKHSINEYNTACRFDVVALDGDINSPKITWLTNAF